MPADLPDPVPREREVALLAVDDAPDDVAERVAALAALGPHALRLRPGVRLRDRYLDTPGRTLRRRHVALRLREQDGTPLLTLKADSRRRGHEADRLELELPWGAASLDAVRAELRRRGIVLPGLAVGTGDPADALSELGLEVVQERETRRRPRDVLSAAGVVAELAVDEVTYRLAAAPVRVVEVELEARAEEADLAALAAALRSLEPSLRPWPTGKLGLGLAIERRLADGRLRPRADGTLPPHAYEGLRAAGASGRGSAGAT